MGALDREKSRRKRKAEIYQYLVKWYYLEVKLMKIESKTLGNSVTQQLNLDFIR